MDKNKEKQLKMMTKKEQLKVAFEVTLKDLFNKLIGHLDYDSRKAIDITAETLLKEVSMRTALK